MSKLHQLLAVEGDLEGTAKKITEETITQFTKHPDRYFGHHQRIELFDENAPEEADNHKAMDDTVQSKLDYTAGHIVRYLDAVLQKETTNQEAKADLVVDGEAIAKDLPATFLLGLETRLKNIRKIYLSIPTLQPGIEWKLDESQGEDVYKRVYPEVKFRTKKVLKNHVKALATKEHPEQVDVYTEDEKVARIITDTWCGMFTVAKKSDIIGRIDQLIRAVKVARQQANTTEVKPAHIADKLFDYING